MNDFNLDDKIIVAHSLLDWCSSSGEMKKLLDGFLLNFLQKFSVEKDQVLSEFIRGLIEQSDYCWYQNESSASWEEQFIVLIQYVECKSLKVDLILMACQAGMNSWPPTFLALGCAYAQLAKPSPR